MQWSLEQLSLPCPRTQLSWTGRGPKWAQGILHALTQQSFICPLSCPWLVFVFFSLAQPIRGALCVTLNFLHQESPNCAFPDVSLSSFCLSQFGYSGGLSLRRSCPKYELCIGGKRKSAIQKQTRVGKDHLVLGHWRDLWQRCRAHIWITWSGRRLSIAPRCESESGWSVCALQWTADLSRVYSLPSSYLAQSRPPSCWYKPWGFLA